MFQQLRRGSLAILFTFLFLSIALPRAHAQSSTDGAIGGSVLDNSGSVVPNATVVVHNNGTNAEQTAITDNSGYFRIIHLQPATYTVTVTAGGFDVYKSKDVLVQVGLLTDLEARLTVGSTSQTVQVTGDAPVINTTSPDFAGVIPQSVLRDLPVSNYRWSSYSLLTPGVVNDSNGFGLLSFRGASTLLNNINIDGTDDNQAYFSEERGRTRAGYSFPKAAVQEFQVNTSNYSVEYGRSAGGIVNSVTKSGSNEFHGEGYYYDRDSAWAATNSSVTQPVQTASGVQALPFKPTDLRRQYGFGIGGPILKDRLFFFFAADKFYHDFPAAATITGNTANANFFSPADPNANCGATTGLSYQDQQVCVISSSTKLSYNDALKVYNSGIAGLTSMLGTAPRTGDQTLYFPRLDWQVNSRNHVSVEANRMRWTSPAGIQTSPAVAYGLRSFGNDYVRDNWIVGKLDTFLTPTLSNEARYMYGRDFEYEFAQSPTQYEQTNLLNTPSGYVNPLGLPVNVNLSGFFQFGTPQFLQRPSYPDERRWQIADTVEWIRGNHDFKFGGDYIHTYDLIQNLFNQFGNYTYSGNTPIGNYLSDLYLSQNAATIGSALHYNTFSQAFGSPGFDFTTGDYSGFVQDQWKFSPRLSLTGGVRYEYEQFPGTIVPNAAIPQTTKMPSNKANIGPRLGFAYDVYGGGKTILRGGYGIFFARAINSTIYTALSSTGAPAGQVSVSFTPTTPGAPGLPTVLTGTSNISAAGGSAYFFDPNFKLPLIHQADLTLEQNIGWDSVFSLSWLGSWGRRLPDFVDTNLPAPTQVSFVVDDSSNVGPIANGTVINANAFFRLSTTKNFRPNAAYGSITDIFSGVTSNYEAMVAQFKHRMSHYVELNANYTWSHALDFGENNTTGASATALLDPTNIRLDYGNSNQNVPNRLVIYGVGQSPWHAHGWLSYLVNDYEISPSFALQTGLPYSANFSSASGTLYTSAGTTQSIISTSSFNGSGGANRVPVFNRNNFQQPRTNVLDLRLSKRIRFREKYAFEFLGEAFNLANHQNVTSVNSTAYTVVLNNVTHENTLMPYSTPFAQTTATNNSNFAYNIRQLQLAVRFQF